MLGLRANHWSRREFLSVGSLGLGGLALPDLLRAEQVGKKAGGLARDKCVVFLFQHGGPSQYETFDPKMSAPAGIRSMTGEIPTPICARAKPPKAVPAELRRNDGMPI